MHEALQNPFLFFQAKNGLWGGGGFKHVYAPPPPPPSPVYPPTL